MNLAQLSRASRVSPRTIRYYIHEGLLPSPGKRGRGARYDRVLLDRLKLIDLLQRDGWPLGKIAERMQELDADDVRRELGAARHPERSSHPERSEGPALNRSTWEHVRVGADVEISVRKPVAAEQRKRVERVIKSARSILGVD